MPVILILMVKNESEIIKRCLDAVDKFVDAFFILDTGSTDETCAIVNTFISENIYKKPFKLAHTTFQTFGKTRSESFKLAKEFITNECLWNVPSSYGLLIDADMIFNLGNFNKETITDYDEYKIIQRQSGLEYHNTRMIRMSIDWKCVGSTHEYWTSGDTRGNIINALKIAVIMSDEKMWIDDVSDGGCKSDKLDRDERLLIEDLEDSIVTNNLFAKQRALFYLAQNYRCKSEYTKAIELYLQRIDVGGWDEEIWASYYNICLMYELLNDLDKSIEYSLKAYEYDNTRSEPLYNIAKVYMLKEDYKSALTYTNMGINMGKNKKKILSADLEIYQHGFYVLKFTILTKISTTTVNELLDAGLNMINKTNKTLYVNAVFVSIIHHLSVKIDITKFEDYFGPYNKVISENVGLSVVIYNNERTKVYTPIIIPEEYGDCIGMDTDGLILRDDFGIYKYKISLQEFILKRNLNY